MIEPQVGEVWQSSNGNRWRCLRELGWVRPTERLREYELVASRAKKLVGTTGQFGDDFVVRHWTLVKL